MRAAACIPWDMTSRTGLKRGCQGGAEKVEAPAVEMDHPVIHWNGSPGMLDIDSLGEKLLDKRTLACFCRTEPPLH